MSFTSTDINECENPNNCNLPGQKCINGLGNFTCFCFKGYHLDRSAGVELCVTNQSKLNRLVLTFIVQVITEDRGLTLDKVQFEMLGTAKKVSVSLDDTIILQGGRDKKLIEERCAERLFEKMPCVYGISPQLEHHSCMVDLFGRAGLLHKAKDIIKTIPYRPTPAMWATLIGACQIYGNTELGEWATEKLLEMRPENSGYYVSIANMYAADGHWNMVAKVRTSMRDLGVRKAPGSAWIDMGLGFLHFIGWIK
ncbi:pentatricopeptide repeat-containing protein [Quercus suber]|uniref:Pentatricopeptide repeat-containing protein n=1 Tax=Quercus suber TaxID=58331 RepID=A0AAW0LFZ6_QUESU